MDKKPKNPQPTKLYSSIEDGEYVVWARIDDKDLDDKRGRPKGLTKRTIDRYIKVYHQFVKLKKNYHSWKKSELYDFAATLTYDGKKYTSDTIRHIIEEKKYNLKPSR
jgi:hypothetical protein